MNPQRSSLGLLATAVLLSVAIPLLPPLSVSAIAQATQTDDRNAEADRLSNEAFQLWRTSQYEAAWEKLRQALDLYRAIGNRQGEAKSLTGLGEISRNFGQYEQALEYHQQALAIVNEIDDRAGKGVTLNNIGLVYNKLGQYEQALEYYQQALDICTEVGDRAGEGQTLTNIGVVYRSLGQYEQALDYYQQALSILTEIGDRYGEGTTLSNIGVVYDARGQYEQALDYYQQALVIRTEIGDRAGEGQTFNNIGAVYRSLGQSEQALDYYQQALAIVTEIDDRYGEGTTLSNIGVVYSARGQYEQALDYYQQALVIRTEIGDRAGEGTTLNNIGAVYRSLGQYEQALEYYQQALDIRTEVGDRAGEGQTLTNIGVVHDNLGQYEQALEYYQQALAILTEIGDRAGEGQTLTNIGVVHDNLGQYEQALEYYQQALAIRTEIGDRSGEGTTFNNIGTVYDDLGRYEQALDYYQQALAIRTEIGDRYGEGVTLNNIGGVYANLGQYEQALEYYQQALAIRTEIGDRSGEGTTFNNIGTVYDDLGRYEQALDYYQQALAIRTEIGDRSGEANTLHNLGLVLEALEEPELAIIFLKQSVNQWEAIRGDIRGLDIEQQQSFMESVSDTYRKLADLLLQADRVLEAQRVLDLLKVQELDEYLEDVERSADTAEGVPNRPPEQHVEDSLNARLNEILTLTRELRELEATAPNDRSEEITNRIIELAQQREALAENFIAFLNSPEVQEQVALLRQTTDGQNLDLSNYRDLQQSLASLEQNAVLLYPFVLDDRLELILVTPDAAVPLRETVPVKREALNAAIANYRSALEDPTSDPLPLAQDLYAWILEPLEDELAAINAETIIYAPDGQLRYIPLGALHDGDQWAVERFRINNITAASLTDIARSNSREPVVFAAAFTEGNYPVIINGNQETFAGLPYAEVEINNLATLMPGTTVKFNEDFNPDTVYLMNSYSVVHLATHAAFVPGDASQSFILFGDGSSVSLMDIPEWELGNVDLIVLSACETGVGDELGDGREILGLGYQMQKAGADAAIASLWSVSDRGTQVLMDAFYTALNNGYSEAEALQRSQQALINNDLSMVGSDRGGIEIISIETGEPVTFRGRLSHPYYWAPFILIGNGL